jgi:hypothetical protein
LNVVVGVDWWRKLKMLGKRERGRWLGRAVEDNWGWSFSFYVERQDQVEGLEIHWIEGLEEGV